MKWLDSFPKSWFSAGLGLGLLGGALIGGSVFREAQVVQTREIEPSGLQVGVTTFVEFREKIYAKTVSWETLGGPKADQAEPFLIEHIGGMMYFFNTDEKFLGMLPEPRGGAPDDPFEYFRKSEVARRAREILSTR